MFERVVQQKSRGYVRCKYSMSFKDHQLVYLNVILFKSPHYVVKKTFVILANNLDECVSRTQQVVKCDGNIAGSECSTWKFIWHFQ